MTRKITISVPDDVAIRLEDESNVSAFVTEAIKRQMRSEDTRELLRQAGIAVTDEGVQHMREKLAIANAQLVARRRAASRNVG